MKLIRVIEELKEVEWWLFLTLLEAYCTDPDFRKKSNRIIESVAMELRIRHLKEAEEIRHLKKKEGKLKDDEDL